MNKRWFCYFVGLLILVSLLSFVSAFSFGDFFGKITGRITYDTTPPKITSAGPVGKVEISFLPSDFPILVSVDEFAICKFSTINEDYNSMTLFESTGGSKTFQGIHRQDVYLTDRGSYSYYIKCKDKAGNINQEPFIMKFTSILNRKNVACEYMEDGKDYYKKGIVKSTGVASSGEVSVESEDYCATSEGTLIKFYCEKGLYERSEFYECPDGCKDGACISKENKTTEEKKFSCNDSDGGINYYKKGEVNAVFGSIIPVDFCVENKVREWYCNGTTGNAEFTLYECLDGCKDGACINGAFIGKILNWIKRLFR